VHLHTVAISLALLCYGGLIYIVLHRGLRGNRLNQVFSLYLLTMVLWHIAYLMVSISPSAESALFWYKVVVAVVSGQFVIYFIFTKTLLRIKGMEKLVRGGLLVWALTVVLATTLQEPAFFTGIRRDEVTGLFVPTFGPLLPILGVPNYLFLGYAIFNLLRGYRSTKSNLQRSRIQYLLLGIATVVLGTMANFVPRLQPYPIDVAANIVNALLITYAILRYQLLDITIVVRKGLLYAIPTAIIGVGYFLTVFLAVNLLHIVTQYQVFLLSLLVAAVTAVIAQPLRDKVQAWVDRLFFREKYDASLMLQRLSRTAASVLDLDRLTNMILEEVTATMHIARAAFFLRQEGSGDYRLMAQKGLEQGADLRLRKDHPIVEWLADHEQALTRREVEVMPQFKALWGQEREDLEKLGAELFIPLKAKGELVGIFAVGPKLSEEAYSQDDQLTLTTLANQTAVAIENARLHQETRRRLEEMATLRETALDISAQLEMSSVLRSIIERVTKLLGAKGGDIYLYDKAKGELRVAVSHNPWGDYTGRTLKLGEGLAGKVVLEGRAISVADYAAWPGHSPRYAKEPFKAVASVPLKWRGRIIGALNVADDTEGRVFDEDDLRLLELFAPQAALAIENARLFEAEAKRRREAETLRQASLALTAALDRNRVIERILAQLQQVVPYDSASIQLLERDKLVIIGGWGFPNLEELLGISFPVNGDNPNRVVMRTLKPFILEDAPAVYEDFKKEPFAAMNIRSWLGVPMLIGNRPVGMITLDKCQPGFYTEEHARLAQAFAAHAAIAIENARLYQQIQDQLNELQALQETTATLQSSLSLQEVLNRIVKAIVGLGYPAAMLAQYEEETNRLVVRAYSVDPALLEMGEALAGKKVMGAYVTLDQTENLGVRMALAGEIGITHSLHDLFRPVVSAEVCQIVQEMAGIKTMATIPLLAKGRLVGNMFVGTEREEITESELESLRAFANQAALAIENAQLYEETIQVAEQMARLFEEAQARVRELAALTEVGEAINRALSLKETLNIVLREAMALVGREEGSIILLDRRTNTLRIVASQGLPPEVVEAFNARPVYAHEGTFGIVIKTGEMLEIPDARSDPRVLHEAGRVPEQLTNVPLRTKEGVIGVIALDALPLDDRARRLLKALADLAAVAIQRAQLFEETQRHLRELHLLFEVGRGITSVLDLEEVLQKIIESAIEAIPAAEKGTLHLLDEERGELVVRASSGFSREVIEAAHFKPGEGYTGWVFEHGEPTIVDNVHTDPRTKPIDLPEVAEEKSAICAPLVAKGKTIGTLTLDNVTTYGAFDERDLELLCAFANQAAIAIENARLYSQTQRRLKELSLLYEVAMAGTAALDLEDALQRIAEALHRHSPFENLGILLLDEATGKLTMKATVGFDPQATERLGLRVGRGITGWVAQTGQPALVPDVSRDPRYRRCTPGMRSELCVPIRIGERVIGVINTESSRPNAFSEEDLKLLTTLAGQVATIIESARLFEETQRLAVTDGLTGLYNRRRFYELLEEEIVRAGRKGVLSLIMLDIDDFKAYNDLYGHLAGDALLRELAQLFRRGIRQGDIVARYGGEEFAIILPGTGKEEATALAERIRAQVEEHLFEGEKGMPAGRITVSLGVASYPQDAREPEALVNAADVALYEAKKRRNRVCVYGKGAFVCLPQGVPIR